MARSKTPTPTVDPRGEWLQLDRQLCFALYSSSLAMTKIYKPLLAPLGLTYPQYLVMLVLWEIEGLSVSQLGQRLSLDSGTLTPLLKRLESLGHIERRRASDDERRVDIFLTPQGRQLRELALDIPGHLACATACELDEVIALTQRLTQLRQQLNKAADAAA
ncbi:MarR family winged helix-turn-helix transcriptional regulator [Roseateles sp. NT4]|uniref:MarR family winged helix-turn-helix transcriptional regulator n=1 Tax=Roseateles sp. NT4 TaxID=3453715 RepID=UPI003EED90D8